MRYPPVNHRQEKMMLLYLQNLINESRGDCYTFFRAAYYWRFNKMLYTDTDSREFRLNGTIPKYVEEYVKHIQEKTCIKPTVVIAKS